MSAVLFALVVAFTGNGGLGSPEALEWFTFDNLCGKLVHYEQLPKKSKQGDNNTAEKPVRHGVLELYPFHEGGPCCSRTLPAARARTSHSGNFKFKKAPAGDYWLFVHLDGRDFKMAVHYRPVKYPDDPCDLQTFYAEESGSFRMFRSIVVD
jgi:hypothetical protein